MSEPRELADVRRELVRMGYLSHRVERFLLQDALVPRDPWRGVPRLAAKVGLLAGSLLALANAVALALANGVLPGAAEDLLPLFLHLAVPATLAAAAGFVALVAGFVVALRALPRGNVDVVRVGAALAAAAALTGAGVSLGWDFLVALPRWPRAGVLAALPLVAAAVAKLLAAGLLAFGIRVTRRAPRERLVSRRTVAAVVAGCVLALAAASLGLPHRAPLPAPSSLATAPGERVALVGVDGVAAEEIDFLLARGELPEIARALAAGGAWLAYPRQERVSPAERWTTIATGQPAGRHGVTALDSFRPLGMSTPLARSGPWRFWWRAEAALGLAEYRPLLASRRRAHAVWELAARGGAPVAAIDWWATYPAEPVAGLVVAHGAHAMLDGDVPGAVEPAARRSELAELAREIAATATPAGPGPGDAAAIVAAALPAADAERVLARALRPDGFYREVARREASSGARAVAVYLPALDLAADGWRGPAPAWSELVRAELAEADRLIATLAREATTLVVVFDPGRRGGAEGRALLLRAGCGAEGRVSVAPESLAAALLRALGLPQSDELPEPPAACPWPEPPARVPSFGERAPQPPAGADAADYLDNLRSLGYL